jgi:hypothetical protein
MNTLAFFSVAILLSGDNRRRSAVHLQRQRRPSVVARPTSAPASR